jgi:hypothetical protein
MPKRLCGKYFAELPADFNKQRKKNGIFFLSSSTLVVEIARRMSRLQPYDSRSRRADMKKPGVGPGSFRFFAGASYAHPDAT